ncbi:MAG: hypothetical protein HND52_02620 [Ignavibacteriae bacterium]|nr:hypothetical protein [Ignavibacteriota bacterium]NOG96844.1 hypothetical protein [Ignavibacteriota bacterium]
MDLIIYTFSALLIYSIFEIICFVGIKLIYKKKRVYYLPKDKPILSRQTVDFISRFIEREGKGTIKEFDKVLGWKSRPNSVSEDGLYKINSEGARSNVEYSEIPKEGITRITTFGDCVTFGEGMAHSKCWQKIMENIKPNFEVINFGVEGFGPAQNYLHYFKNKNVYTDQKFVLIAFVSTNIYKPINMFRPFYSFDHGLQLSKPGYVLQGNSLELVNNPIDDLIKYKTVLENQEEKLIRIGTHDHYFKTTYRSSSLDFLPSVKFFKIIIDSYKRLREVFNRHSQFCTDSLAYKTTLKILEKNCIDVKANSSIPVIILFPLKNDLRNYFKNGIKPWQPMLDHFNKVNLPFIDMLDAFKNHSSVQNINILFSGRNYSETAHRIIGETAVKFITKMNSDL